MHSEQQPPRGDEWFCAKTAGYWLLMSKSHDLTRRAALTLGTTALGGVAVGGGFPGAAAASKKRVRGRHGSLPAGAIQSILGLQGSISSGVLGVSVARKDIGKIKGARGVVFPPSFQNTGDLKFMPLSSSRAFFNGDLALKSSELNPVVHAIIENGLTFQAMHQHFTDLDPMVWFIHFRGEGEPKALARAVRKVLAVTSTPLPQKMPKDPTTPLDHAKLAKTLHGTSEIGEDGVVTISVNRRDRILIGGDVHVDPEANISTNIQFLPLNAQGTRAAAAPDFSMTATEIEPVCRTMQAAGFGIGCLYNQEIAEDPQLYFAHMISTGAPQALAVAIRKGLDHTNAD